MVTKREWTQMLDFHRALKNCHFDFIGDWYRDPWGWFELDWVVRNAVDDVLVPRMNASGVFQAARLDVAKENFTIRPAVVLDPVDRLCYQALVDSMSRRLLSGMPDWGYGWRPSRRNPRPSIWLSQSKEWGRYRSHLKRLADWYNAGLKTDIVSFFASIPFERIGEDLLQVSGAAPTRRLVEMLRGFDAMTGRSGLPQRCAASAALAHFYLSPLDEAMQRYSKARGLASKLIPEGRVLRWMDDIWIFGPSPGPLRKAQVEIQMAMRELGLAMNVAKTDVLEGSVLWEEANRVEHSAVDGGFAARPPDSTPLNELLDRILQRPEHADRTSVKFGTLRMRQHSVFDRVGEFSNAAPRMPHASDALARLFRDSSAWRDLQEWYVKYCGTSWACIDWATAQLGTMFPSSDVGTGVVRGYLAERISDPSLAVAALAAQRLAAWDPDVARQAIREAAKSADHPLHRRVLALSSLMAGEKRAFVRSLLQEFEENALTLRVLEETNFRKPKVKADFQGG